jgi:poly(A) polymerase
MHQMKLLQMKLLKKKTLRVDLTPDLRDPLTELVHDVAPVAKRLGLRVFLVGGAVRDLMAGRAFSGDWDLVVFGAPKSIGDSSNDSVGDTTSGEAGGDANAVDGNGAGELARSVAKVWKWREPVSFPRFGTYLVIGKGEGQKESKVEFSQARLRTRLLNLDPDPLVSDALSRDFTINALYFELTGGDHSPSKPLVSIEVLDPTGRGIADLDNKLLRTPLPARITFTDDPLRIFRAARFKAVSGYRFHPSIGRVAVSMVDQLSGVAPERIREELELILLSEKPSWGLEPLGRWGALTHIAPEIQAMVGFVQDTPWHFPDLFRHTLRVVDRSPQDLATRWAALLHDCGKPMTRVPSEDGDSYYGHDAVGADIASRVLKGLKCSRDRVKEVSELVRLHMVHYQDEWSERAVGRFIRRAGSCLDKLLDLVEADSSSLRLRRGKVQELKRLRERVAGIRDKLPASVSPLDGQSIMDLLGVESGALVGRAKGLLAEAVAEGRVAPSEEAARVFLLDWYAQLEESRRQ